MQGIQEANSKVGVISDMFPEELAKKAFDIAEAMVAEYEKREKRITARDDLVISSIDGIKKSSWFLCVKDVVLKNTNIKEYNEGQEYRSDIDGCITNEFDNENRQWSGNTWKQYFRQTC